MQIPYYKQHTPFTLSEYLLGISLAFILQTSIRFDFGFGFGEIGLVIYIGYASLKNLRGLPYLASRPEVARGMYLNLYLLGILLPVTLIAVAFGTEGASLRDFVAYALSFFMVLAIGFHRPNLKNVTIILVASLLFIIVLQFAFGGSNAWYSSRFTGGAKNPNQLALYIVCALILVAVYVDKAVFKYASFGVLFFFGIRTLSDAFALFSIAVFFLIVAFFLFPKKRFLLGVSLMILGVAIALTFFENSLLNQIFTYWNRADEGGSRTTLYLNGLFAWLSTPFSILLGNGAGSFSGHWGPFEGIESHNSPIDLLAMGGILGFLCVYVALFKSAIRSYRKYLILIFAGTCGLLVFSIFHYVVRHPIFWFTDLVLTYELSKYATRFNTERG